MKLEEKFQEELYELLNEKFKERVVNLKKTGNIFSPIFYLIFTRLVELSSIMNDVVLPNEFEVREMFRTRKEFLQLDYSTINETIRRMWFFESRRAKEYSSSKSMEDFLYIVYRMKDIQEKIDRAILNNIRDWNKEEISRLYFLLIRLLLELDEEANESVRRIIQLEFARELLKSFLGRKGEEIGNSIQKILEKGELGEKEIKGLQTVIDRLKPRDRGLVTKIVETLFDHT
jgi:hypothetical protein